MDDETLLLIWTMIITAAVFALAVDVVCDHLERRRRRRGPRR